MKGRSSVAFSLFAKVSFKILMVGAKDVGKTSLILRYIKKTFTKTKTAALGVEFYSNTIQIGKDQIALQIWDTAGSDNFKTITKSCYHQANCVVITYSDPLLLTSTLNEFILQINQNAQAAVIVLIARTKIDESPVTAQQKIKLQEYVEKQENIAFWMALSAKTGESVDDFFQTVANALYVKYHEDQNFKEMVDPKKQSFVLNNEMVDDIKKKQKKKCCS